MFLAVDPSIEKTGYALVADGQILHVGAVETNVKNPDGERLSYIGSGIRSALRCHENVGLVIEVPGWYGKKEKDPISIMKLNKACGAIIGAFDWTHVHCYEPRQWKGQVDKEIYHETRVLPKLEKHIIMAVRQLSAKAQGDALDACGLALFEVENAKRPENKTSTKRTETDRRRYRRRRKEARRARKAHKSKTKND